MPDNAGTSATKTSAQPVDLYDRFATVVQWAVGALGVVAGTAIAKVAIDQLKNGDYSGDRLPSVLASAGAFAFGVVFLIGAVISATTISAPGLSWLLEAKAPNAKPKQFWRGLNTFFFGRDPYLAWVTLESLGTSRYLLPTIDPDASYTPALSPGTKNESPAKQALRGFLNGLDFLVSLQVADPPLFLASAKRVKQLKIGIEARQNLLGMVKRIRMQRLSRALPYRFMSGALAATLGAIGFLYATSQAQRAATRDDLRIAAGTLLPKVPAQVTVVGDACKDDRVGTLFEIASHFDTANVMHVYLPKTKTCNGKTAWLPPERVIPASESGVATTTTTSAPSGS